LLLDLDFAFFNMRDNNRQGLANRKTFLDRLAPLLFPPRVEKLIDLERLGVKGCNVKLPLGEGNWKSLNQDNRGLMIDKTAAILDEFEIDSLGVDRRLKPIFATQSHNLPVRFGDHFINALAAVLVDQAVKTHDIKKMVVVGQIPELASFLNFLGRYHLPISMQNYNPGRYEILAYRLLYEEGLAVSNSCLNPRLWGRGDLIISVDAKSLAMASREAFYIRLDDERFGLAPDLEHALQVAGLASGQSQSLTPAHCRFASGGKSKTSTRSKSSPSFRKPQANGTARFGSGWTPQPRPFWMRK
jgi:hypothetical protein